MQSPQAATSVRAWSLHPRATTHGGPEGTGGRQWSVLAVIRSVLLGAAAGVALGAGIAWWGAHVAAARYAAHWGFR